MLRTGAVVAAAAVVAYVFFLTRGVEAVEVVTFQPDGLATLDTIGIYKGKLDRNVKLDSVSLCGRFKFYFLHGRDTFFQLKDEEGNQPWMIKAEVWPEKLRPAIAARWNFMMLPEILQSFRWYHVCFTYSAEEKEYNTWLDGELIVVLPYNINRQIYGDYAYIGQGVEIMESYSGEITQVNVWDRVLTPEEIVSLAECKSDIQGNYISWNVGWELRNVKASEVPLEDLCKRDTGAVYFWFPDLPHTTSYYICEALGSHLPLPITIEEAVTWLVLGEEMWGSSTRCSSEIIVATNDIQTEGTWIKHYDNSLLGESAWMDGEPNGLVYENCAQIENGGMADIDCVTRVQCAVCEFRGPQAFSLVGACEIEMRNINYLVYQWGLGELLFRGYGAYTIEKIGSTWSWLDAANNLTVATMVPTIPNFPMGRRKWKLNRQVCDQLEGERELLLTQCSGDEYSCDDGTCIHLDNRCDLKYDCLDHSDEVDCELVEIPINYKSDLPPRHMTRDGPATLPVILNVIIESMAVETSNMVMQVSHQFTQLWFDNRLTFLNIKRNISLNTFSYRTILKLWSPVLSFVNTDGNQVTSLNSESTMRVDKREPPFGRDDSVPAETELYTGGDNPLSVMRKYSTGFICDFDLVLYPFDTQHCDMHLRMFSASTAYLKFDVEGSEAVYTGSELLIEYEIGKPFIIAVSDTEFSEMRIRFPLKRRWGYAILNIYTPSLVLITISYSTLYFRAHIFEVRVMTALTALLVEATLFAQVSQSLPKTSYFKMVDVWLLFCIVVIFFIILFHAVIDYLLEYEPKFSSVGPLDGKGGSDKIRILNGQMNMRSPEPPDPSRNSFLMIRASRIVISTLVVSFNFLYWSFIMA